MRVTDSSAGLTRRPRSRAPQLHSVTWTVGRNRVAPTPVPRIIACVQRGVVMKFSNTVTAGWRLASGTAVAHHSPGACRFGP